MNNINYLELMDLVSRRIEEEEREIDGADLFFLFYLLELASIDDTISDKEFIQLEDAYDEFKFQYDMTIDDEPKCFEIDEEV